jgi:hypothetical protein
MNSQPLYQPLHNVPGASGSAQKTRKGTPRPKQQPADPYQKARRKRVASRQKRRFDAVIARLPKPPSVRLQLQSIPVPTVVLPTPWSWSKALSILLLLGALGSIGWLHTAEAWFVYREDVRFHNLIRMRGDDLYAALNLDGLNVFWVEPEAVRATLLDLPWVEDAQVAVTLPAGISVSLTEMTPAAVWVTNHGNYWLAMNGDALPIATLEESALPELALPQIVDSLQEARKVGDGPLAIEPEVLTSALTLMAALPELENSVRYNELVGLNFALPEPAVWVYWGDGFDLETKLKHLEIARAQVRRAEEPVQIVDVSLVDRPYFR